MKLKRSPISHQRIHSQSELKIQEPLKIPTMMWVFFK